MTIGKPLRVAVVGAGPAGLYVADGLCFEPGTDVRVDLLERLPTPYGLLRYGVAPDHARMKALIETLQQVLEDPRVRFLGNVELGRDVTAHELRGHYDAVVYATGAPADRRLGVPGEDLAGSFSAGQVVGWYSGHPDAPQVVSLDCTAAVVVGAGNVALDIARVLTKGVHQLAGTDIPSEVLAVLVASRLRDVHLLCRRGPAHTRFTSKELRELGELPGVDVVIDPDDLALSPAEEAAEQASPALARNLGLLRAWAARPPTRAPRRLHLRFWSRPVEITGTEQVDGVLVERTTSSNGELVGTGSRQHLAAGLVVRSAGFAGRSLPGVPWDPDALVVPHGEGRVLRDGHPSPDEYVVGWCGRGASGVLGSNRPDADRVVEHLLRSTPPPGALPDLVALLRGRGVDVVLQDGWQAIDRLERRRGEQQDREREKVRDWTTLLGAVRGAEAGAVA